MCPFANVTDQIVSLLTKNNHKRAAAAGSGQEVLEDGHQEFKWKHNGLRHSFISYRVGVIKNVAQVALEAGNSPQVIFSNYRELVTEKAAKEWFAITPEAAAEVRAQIEREHQAKMVAFPAKVAA